MEAQVRNYNWQRKFFSGMQKVEMLNKLLIDVKIGNLEAREGLFGQLKRISDFGLLLSL